MIGWIKYLWEFDWSKENDIFDSCQVLSQHESEILNDLDQRLGAAISASRRKFPNKKDNIKLKKASGTRKRVSITEHLSLKGETLSCKPKQFFLLEKVFALNK